MNTFSDLFTWAVFVAEVCLCSVMLCVAVRRKLYRRLLFFSIYLAVNVVCDVLWRWISLTPLFYVLAWAYVYWSLELLLSIPRLLTIVEISRRLLRAYPAVWAFASYVLAAATGVLLLWTVDSTIHNVHHIRRFIILGDQRFEFMQTVLPVFVFMIAVYYRIQITPIYRLVLIGISIFSSTQVVNNAVGIHTLILPNSIFDYIRRGSMIVSIGVWMYAVWRYSSFADPQPPLISQNTYDRLSPEIHDWLQLLNARLATLLRQRTPSAT